MVGATEKETGKEKGWKTDLEALAAPRMWCSTVPIGRLRRKGKDSLEGDAKERLYGKWQVSKGKYDGKKQEEEWEEPDDSETRSARESCISINSSKEKWRITQVAEGAEGGEEMSWDEFIFQMFRVMQESTSIQSWVKC